MTQKYSILKQCTIDQLQNITDKYCRVSIVLYIIIVDLELLLIEYYTNIGKTKRL